MELVNYVNSIISYLDKCKQVHIEAGDTYNIFQVIHMTSNETSIHSAFVSDLLNPLGRHHMGGIFLRLFIDMLPEEHKNSIGDFDTEHARVTIEEFIGEKTEYTGGRLDIVIKSITNGIEKAIIIENKIYAEDQFNQMIRYYNYADENYKNNHLLLYLSLDGKVHDLETTAHSKKKNIKEGEHFFTISYKDFIKDWLIECRKKVETKPLIREAISHYINLIGILTGQSNNMTERKEAACIIANHPELIKELETAVAQSKRELQRKFWHELIRQVSEDKELSDSMAFWAEESNDGDTTNIIEKIDGKVDHYIWDKKHKQYGLSFEIGKIDCWKLYFVVSVNCNLLFIVSASKDGNHNLNLSKEVPTTYKSIMNKSIPKGWEPEVYRLWGTYPDGVKLSFGNPNAPLYTWCADMENNVASMILNIKRIIKELSSLCN